jgi:phosphoglycerate dehydrogenase-like enzyme
MTHILVCTGFQLKEPNRARLREAFPSADIVYTEGKAPTPEQLQTADFILGNPAPGLLAHCKKLRVLQLNSAGTDGYTEERVPAGAVLCNATGAYGRAVSEHMLASLLTVMKKLHRYRDNQNAGLWADEGVVGSIADSTVVILGLGDIGVSLARQIKALGGKVIGVRRSGTDKPDFVDELYPTEKIDEALSLADVVALSLPSTPATKGILSRERLFGLKQGAYVVNGGRGDAIDQDALCDALEQGHLAGAALDVTSPEPLPAGHRLWTVKNALITPHISGGGHMACIADTLVEIAIHNFSASLTGEPLRNVVDYSTGYRKL